MPTRFERALIIATDGKVLRRISKVLPLSDGGFAITVPYHAARSGTLLKLPWSAKVGTWSVSVDLAFPFEASDRVKLSCHADGFAQFSGENSSKILSGRDAEGLPKGVGLMTQPLRRPLVTGPTAICSVWGLQEFDAYTPRARETPLIFESESDFYVDGRVRPTVRFGEGNGVAFSFLTFPASFFPSEARTGAKFLIAPKAPFAPAEEFKAQLIRVSPELTLAVIANAVKFKFASESGFQLVGPSDLKHSIMAQYPPLLSAGEAPSLDYVPNPPPVSAE